MPVLQPMSVQVEKDASFAVMVVDKARRVRREDWGRIFVMFGEVDEIWLNGTKEVNLS